MSTKKKLKSSENKRKAGRPSKKVPKYIDRLLDNLRAGMSIEAACTQANLGRSTVDEWRRSDPAFNAEFEAACDFAEAVMLADIKRLGNEKSDWRAIAWILERRFPERWSLKREVDMTIDKKGDGTDLVASMIQQASEHILNAEQSHDEE
jgi:transposase